MLHVFGLMKDESGVQSEAVAQRCSVQKGFLKISQNS